MTDSSHASPFTRFLRAKPLALSILVALLFMAGGADTLAANTTYYRWVDDEGVTHYTSTPPQGIAAEKVTSTTRAGRSPKPKAADRPNDEGNTADSAVAQQEDDSLKDPKRCDRARQRLKTLESGRRIRIQGEDGEIRFLTEEGIREEIELTRQAIEQSC